MATLRIKLCGLNDVDTRSLKSMLSVANDQLSNKWKIVNSDPAELYIYSFDTEEGITAWQNHDHQYISALLSSDNDSDEAIDIIIKKPLRTKNFSSVLNEIEKRTIVSKTKPPSVFSSLLSSLGNALGKKSNRLARPVLNLTIPEQGSESENVILDLPILEQFLKDIDHNNDILKAEDLTANLLALNHTNIQTEKRFKLLELYGSSIRQLMSNQLAEKNKVKQGSHTDYIKVIHTLNRLLKEIVIAYQIIVNDYYQQNKKPKSQNIFLIAINHVAEYLELSILHAYHYYFVPPHKAINTLHQLYLYCEYHKVLNTQVQSSSTKLISFIHTYTATLLTGIANPSRLLKSDIFRLFELMDQFADKITISQMQEQQISLDDTGYFKIDTSSDKFPCSLTTESELELTTQNQCRLFNTQPILESIEELFQQESHSSDLALLKKIIPQFNATYARHFKRKPYINKPKVELLLGISIIYEYLTTKTYSASFHCTIHNEGSGGIMISCEALDSYSVEIGDIVGILDSKSKHQLAVVRWMASSEEGRTHIGLEFQLEPIPVKMSLENKTDSFNGLLLPGPIKKNLNNTIIVNKGTYLPLQTINVTEGQKTYKIVINSLIDSPLNCEQFSFNQK